MEDFTKFKLWRAAFYLGNNNVEDFTKFELWRGASGHLWRALMCLVGRRRGYSSHMAADFLVCAVRCVRESLTARWR